MITTVVLTVTVELELSLHERTTKNDFLVMPHQEREIKTRRKNSA